MKNRETIMLRTSPSEQKYLEAGIEHNLRADGRSRVDFRSITLETGVIDQTNGSARLRLANTDVLVGVKVEISTPEPTAPNEGIIKFYVEWFVSFLQKPIATKNRCCDRSC